MQFNPIALREFLRLRMMSQAELTKKAGISAGYLSDLLKGTKSNPSRPTVRNIAEALEIDPRALFIEAPVAAEHAA